MNTYRALGSKHKRDRSPSKRIEHHEQVHADDGKDRVSTQGGSWSNRVHSLIDSNVEHGESLPASPYDEGPFSPKLFRGEH